MQKTSGGSGSISGCRGIDSENLYFSAIFVSMDGNGMEMECNGT